MKFTSEILEKAYVFLCSMPPFDRWKLPDSNQIEFTASQTRYHQGEYSRYIRGPKKGTHTIAISRYRIRHLTTLLKIMGHEMIHLKLAIDGTETPGTEHNAEFVRLLDIVCRRQGWDPGDY
jgi:hypothetical protein